MPFKPLIFLTFPKMRGCLSTLGGLTAPGLDVLGPNGKVLASDHGPNPDALVHFTAPDAGTYFLDVSGDGGLTGHYILIA